MHCPVSFATNANPTFDSFPMFSHDGKKVVFASNRNNAKEGETNVFVADWVDKLQPGDEANLKGQAEIDKKTWRDRAAYLSSPDMKGRGLGTPELEKAAGYIAQQFAMVGLKPLDGAPISAVTMPIGNSAGASARRASRSASSRRMAPAIIEAGSNVR